MGRNRKPRTKNKWSFSLKPEYFKYEGNTWQILHRLNGLIYAIETNSKDICFGPVERFRTISGGEMMITMIDPAHKVMTS